MSAVLASSTQLGSTLSIPVKISGLDRSNSYESDSADPRFIAGHRSFPNLAVFAGMGLLSFGRLGSRAGHCPRSVLDARDLARAVLCYSLHLERCLIERRDLSCHEPVVRLIRVRSSIRLFEKWRIGAPLHVNRLAYNKDVLWGYLEPARPSL